MVIEYNSNTVGDKLCKMLEDRLQQHIQEHGKCTSVIIQTINIILLMKSFEVFLVNKCNRDIFVS